MKTEKHTRQEMKQTELESLARTLGPVGAVQFLQQLGRGTGSQAADKSHGQGKSHVPTLTHKSKAQNRKQP